MSIESMPIEDGPAGYIGWRRAEGRIHLYYRDRKGAYWYRTVFEEESGYISEFEHIFGKKRPEPRPPAAWAYHAGAGRCGRGHHGGA